MVEHDERRVHVEPTHDDRISTSIISINESTEATRAPGRCRQVTAGSPHLVVHKDLFQGRSKKGGNRLVVGAVFLVPSAVLTSLTIAGARASAVDIHGPMPCEDEPRCLAAVYLREVCLQEVVLTRGTTVAHDKSSAEFRVCFMTMASPQYWSFLQDSKMLICYTPLRTPPYRTQPLIMIFPNQRNFEAGMWDCYQLLSR